MLDQKWKWIAVLIDCASDISVAVEKFKLNWFNLKKFIGKKNGGSYNKELSKTGGGPRKTVNSAKSGLVSPSNKLKWVFFIPKFLSSFISSYNKAMMNQAIMCGMLFFLYYLPTTCETSVIVSKKTSVNSTSGQSISDFFRRFELVHKQFEPFSVFFLKKKNVCTNKNVSTEQTNFWPKKNF